VTLMSVRIALRALARNRVRSSLTMLGVIIGVAAVIATVAIGQGASEMVRRTVASMGQSQLTVFPGATSSGGLSFGAGSAQTLTPDDAAAIARECPSVQEVAVIVRARAQVVYQDQNWAPNTVQGCDPTYLVARDWAMAEGECFTESDVKIAAQVCILGRTVADKLFAEDSPVGQRVRVKGLPFKVLGVLDKKGTNTWGQDQDDVLLLPWTTVKKKLQGSQFNNVDQIVATAATAEALIPLEDEIRRTLRGTHRLDRKSGPEAMDDFQVRNFTEMLASQVATQKTMAALIAGIAAVSLLVGGIGIMNIMLVSVTERTREIGLRMAVGARRRDLLAQFLVEASVLSGIGGLVGIAIGASGASFAASAMRWPVILAPEWMVLAVGFSAAVGVLFGFYPAWRASRLDPIDALRYE
jgi:putative ABC transport system permease protein